MQMFVIINNIGIIINTDVNKKNWLTKNHENDYENCKCRKKLADKLVEEFSESINTSEMIYNDYGNACNSSIIYIVLFVNAFINNRWNKQCFYLFSLILKKKMY